MGHPESIDPGTLEGFPDAPAALATAHAIEPFFRSELDRAIAKRRVAVAPLTEQYLVQLLASYVCQPIEDEPLGRKLLAALSAAPGARREGLRTVGDTSLFVSGFWSDSLLAGAVDVDYYVQLGGVAYAALARTGPGWAPTGGVFQALAAQFAQLVGVLALVGQRLVPAAPPDIVRLYERWMQTHSRWLASRLASLGVLLQDGGQPSKS
jgi:small basic protein